jgi:hypothetical protein
MQPRIISVDQATGAQTKMHVLDGDDIVIENTMDVAPLLELNKAKYNQTDERARWGEWAQVASIDLVTWFDLKKKGILDDQKRLKAWLNDPANMAYRTRPGRV